MVLRYGLLALTLAACSGSTSPSYGGSPKPPPGGGGNMASVAIANTAYAPSSITVKAGTTVTWTNDDGVTHSVTSDAGTFAGGDLSGTMMDPYGGMTAGGSLKVTFTTAGTYDYHCNYHAAMHGMVTVSP